MHTTLLLGCAAANATYSENVVSSGIAWESGAICNYAYTRLPPWISHLNPPLSWDLPVTQINNDKYAQYSSRAGLGRALHDDSWNMVGFSHLLDCQCFCVLRLQVLEYFDDSELAYGKGELRAGAQCWAGTRRNI